ncbi:sigma-54-dependent transcriptional regulator [Pelagibaculum spongiae]|uniref:Sigma-54-dependent Fis family transcriptional regulator n=1 Tax=Pelagibaculum spongiae TaxID=2080658 RepID=A0A2V1GZI8_9GAMM|nr:sigma-54 dependent transcriptional regulator [Pelagibaculum spongiae]PVZ72464.1 sigma-54-dependent Fis family transcriptional regulator [Pelagibaculum spongiae]
MTQPLALIVDDEPDIRELLEITLGRMGLQTRGAGTVSDARQLLRSHNFQICLTDMKLPDGNGLELVELIQNNHPQLPVAVITAHGNMETAIRGLKAGAFDFVSKPVDLKVLRELVQAALKLPSGQTASKQASDIERTMLGQSPAMQLLRATIRKLSRSQAPVFISGASGTGKEMAARMIHALGPRAEKPFVPVNCGAIPSELMESEFFGHKKGSFTGAHQDKQGLFQSANGGTLFLDEVADLPLAMQVKLLRAIQEKAVRPVGSEREIPVDVRLLSATHKDLHKLISQSAFREDLFYRINVIQLSMPSLSERPQDIEQLALHFLQKLARRNQQQTPSLLPDALNALKNYHYQGNVRELENILERALALCENDTINTFDLQLTVKGPSGQTARPAGRGNQPLEEYIDQVERQAINEALVSTGGNRTKAAELLGISFRALRYRLKKLGMDPGRD